MAISRYSQPIQAQYIPTSPDPQMQMALLQKREQDQAQLDQNMTMFESTLNGITAYGDEDSKQLKQKQQVYQREMSNLYDKYGENPGLMLRASKDLNKKFGMDVESGDLANINKRYNIAQETIKDAQERFGKGELTPEAYQWQLDNAATGARAQKDPGIYKQFEGMVESKDYSEDMFNGDPQMAMDNAVNMFIKNNEVQLSYMDKEQQAEAIDNARRIFANKWTSSGNSISSLGDAVQSRRYGMQKGYENKPKIKYDETYSFNEDGSLRSKYEFGKDGNMPQNYMLADDYLKDVKRQLADNRAVYHIPEDMTDKEALKTINSFYQKNANYWAKGFSIGEDSKVADKMPKLYDGTNKMNLSGSQVWVDGKQVNSDELYAKLYKASGADNPQQFNKMLQEARPEVLAAGNEAGALKYVFLDKNQEPIDIEISNPDEDVKNLMSASYNLTKAVAEGNGGEVKGVVGKIEETGDTYHSAEIAYEWNEETKQPEVVIYPLNDKGYRIVYKEGDNAGKPVTLDLNQIQDAESKGLAKFYADKKKK